MTRVPDTMTAVLITGKGGPEVLVAQRVPTPQPGPGQLLVKVAAAGVNRPDVLQRKGLYPAPKGTRRSRAWRLRARSPPPAAAPSASSRASA